MHVHVAMPDKQTTIDMMNMVRYFLPHLLALSTSSPFWMGRNTGLKSFRTTVFRPFPAHPASRNNSNPWSAYEKLLSLLVKLNCIDSGKKIWWDVAASHVRYTGVPHVRRRYQGGRSGAIAALTQAIVVKLHRLYTSNMSFRVYRRR